MTTESQRIDELEKRFALLEQQFTLVLNHLAAAKTNDAETLRKLTDVAQKTAENSNVFDEIKKEMRDGDEWKYGGDEP